DGIRDYKVTGVQTCALPICPGENLGEHLAHAGVPWETELRLSRKVHLADVVHDARRLAELARTGRYDVLHAAFAHDHSLALWAEIGRASCRERVWILGVAAV